MKVSSRLILCVCFIFILGIFLWAIFAPKEEISDRIYKTIKEQEKQADLAFKDVLFEEASDGIKYWALKSKTATLNKSTNLSSLQTVKGWFYKNGKAVLTFVSPAALWDMQKKEIYLDQPIGYDVKLEDKINDLVRTAKLSGPSIFNLPKLYQGGYGYWFKARNLSWKMNGQKIFCTGGIVLNKGEVTGYADRLQGDVAMEKIVLEGKPHVIIDFTPSSLISVEADLLEVVSSQNIIKFIGHVIVTYKDSEARGDHADYFVKNDRILLEGNAWAQQNENKINGDKIIVSVKDGRITVAGKGKVVITEDKLNGTKN